MSSESPRKSILRKLFFAGALVILVIIGLFGVKYQNYIYAVVWHSVHGNYVQVDGHRMKLPLLWWKREADTYDTTLLVRAARFRTPLESTITVDPLLLGEASDTDQEVLRIAQAMVSSRQNNSTWDVVSLVTITPKPFNLYCMRDDLSLVGYINIMCHAATARYSYTYQGHSIHEKEAMQIFSSIE